MTPHHTWFPVPDHSDFSIHNLPFGIFSTPDRTPRVGIAIGEHIIDLADLAQSGLWDNIAPASVFEQNTLNAFIRLGKKTASAVRLKV